MKTNEAKALTELCVGKVSILGAIHPFSTPRWKNQKNICWSSNVRKRSLSENRTKMFVSFLLSDQSEFGRQCPDHFRIVAKFIVVKKCSATVAQEWSNPSSMFSPSLFRREICPRSQEMRYCVSMWLHKRRERCTTSFDERSKEFSKSRLSDFNAGFKKKVENYCSLQFDSLRSTIKVPFLMNWFSHVHDLSCSIILRHLFARRWKCSDNDWWRRTLFVWQTWTEIWSVSMCFLSLVEVKCFQWIEGIPLRSGMKLISTGEMRLQDEKRVVRFLASGRRPLSPNCFRFSFLLYSIECLSDCWRFHCGNKRHDR